MRHLTVELSNTADTSHVPLACLGYALRQAEVLRPLQEIELPMKTIVHSPAEKLLEALVLILAGGRSTAQIDVLLRPNRALAQAWGQSQFAQQATVAGTLDALDSASVGLLRSGFETMLRDCSLSLHHDFRTGDLWLDGDLTGLPASRRAEGSTHGYFAGEKTVWDANSRASVWHPMARRSARSCIPVFNRVWAVFSQWSNGVNASCVSKPIKSHM